MVPLATGSPPSWIMVPLKIWFRKSCAASAVKSTRAGTHGALPALGCGRAQQPALFWLIHAHPWTPGWQSLLMPRQGSGRCRLSRGTSHHLLARSGAASRGRSDLLSTSGKWVLERRRTDHRFYLIF
uniref:Uncharacterized protein n=1 Tax=Rousettus aegyptiacus TaxID=9407 RepID=A0A7J8CHN8_ROUAE|nr:hypothetical protein HJG63_008944 [Rousettus aegyptiacus]